MKNIIIHLGVHKTATTYLQNTLWSSNKILKDQNIGYIPLSTMRSGITAAIANDSHSPKDVHDLVLKSFDKQYETILLSDENILGGINDIYSNNEISPNYKYRITKLQNAFKNYNIVYFVSLRNYAQYYSSIYCEFLRHTKKYVSFKGFLSKFNFLQYSWQELIKNILETIDGNDLNVFTFEKFIKNEDFYFNALLNTKNLKLIKHNASNDRMSYRNKTIEMMDYLSLKFSNQIVIQLIDSLDSNLKKIDFNNKYIPWAKSEQDFFDEKYNNDLKELKSMEIKLI